MAAKAPWEDGGTPPIKPDGQPHPNSPFNGSLTMAQLAAEIGRCLRSRHAGALKEPLLDELAILVRRLQEREQGTRPPGPSEPDTKLIEP